MNELFLKAQHGDNEALNELFNEYKVIVEHEMRRARKIGMQAFDLEDMEQELNLALLRCIKGFDTERGLSFYTYGITSLDKVSKKVIARNRMNKLSEIDMNLLREINKLKRKNVHITNEEICEILDVNLQDLNRVYSLIGGLTSLNQSINSDEEDTTVGDMIADSEDSIEKLHNKMIVKQLLNILPKNERDLITLYFYENKTQKEIGEMYGCNQVYISRHIGKILKKMRKTLDNNLII